MSTTPDLLANPFVVLGASARDDRRKIIELADARALDLADEVCQKARSDLTNPRSRLGAEVKWLPGLSPSRADQLTRVAIANPLSLRTDPNIPDLAKANLLAAALQSLSGSVSANEAAGLIEDLAASVDRLDPAAIQRDINEDRSVSGFPQVTTTDGISELLVAQARFYRTAAQTALDSLPSDEIVTVITALVNDGTIGGKAHAPHLIDELVDAYELEARTFLEREEANLDRLLEFLREIAPRGERALDPALDEVEQVIQNWDRVAQPIQLSAKARGLTHQPSRNLAMKIRSVAIDLWNEHQMLNAARRMTETLEEVFAELPDVEEKLGNDADALDRIANERDSAIAEQRKQDEAMNFEARVGLMGHPLKLTADGITWKTRFHPFSLITKIRWGGVNNSINGIPTGSTFTIGFGNDGYEAVIETGDSRIYSECIERLWPAVCVRLLVEMIRNAGDGRHQIVGSTGFTDSTILLAKHKVFGKPTLHEIPWNAIEPVSHQGTFSIVSKTDRTIAANLPYLTTWNAHILEHIVDLTVKKRLSRLSALLE
jgi:hypothetical protein